MHLLALSACLAALAIAGGASRAATPDAELIAAAAARDVPRGKQERAGVVGRIDHFTWPDFVRNVMTSAEAATIRSPNDAASAAPAHVSPGRRRLQAVLGGLSAPIHPGVRRRIESASPFVNGGIASVGGPMPPSAVAAATMLLRYSVSRRAD